MPLLPLLLSLIFLSLLSMFYPRTALFLPAHLLLFLPRLSCPVLPPLALPDVTLWPMGPLVELDRMQIYARARVCVCVCVSNMSQFSCQCVYVAHLCLRMA